MIALQTSQPDGRACEAWQPKTIRLRYSLSYVKLFEVAFSALEDTRPFDPERPPADDPQPPFADFPSGCDAIVVRHELLKSPIPVLTRLPNCIRYAPRQQPHFYTDLRGGPEQAFKTMSSKTRSTVVRKVKQYKAFCGGEIRWVQYRTPAEMETFQKLARELARKTYQERLFGSGLPEGEEFRTRVAELATQDAVRGFLLFHGDKPVAYLYTPAPDGFLVYEYLGYDPEYAKHSPGTVLQYLVLEMLYGDQRFPFYYWGYGYSQAKQVFSTNQVLGADIFYIRPTLRNRIAAHLNHGFDRFSERAGKALESMHLKGAIKRWLKRQ